MAGPRAIRSASVSPFDQFHDERTAAVGFLEAVDGADVRVIERGEDARLSLEAREAIRVGGECQRQDLDRHVASKPRVARAVDLAHPANTELGANLIRAEASAWGEGHVGIEG